MISPAANNFHARRRIFFRLHNFSEGVEPDGSLVFLDMDEKRNSNEKFRVRLGFCCEN